MRRCNVPFCKAKKDELRKVHKFPSDPIMYKKWITAIGLKKNDRCLFVCSTHFREKDYTLGGKLKPEAVPSIRINLAVPKANSPPIQTKVKKTNCFQVKKCVENKISLKSSIKSDRHKQERSGLNCREEIKDNEQIYDMNITEKRSKFSLPIKSAGKKLKNKSSDKDCHEQSLNIRSQISSDSQSNCEVGNPKEEKQRTKSSSKTDTKIVQPQSVSKDEDIKEKLILPCNSISSMDENKLLETHYNTQTSSNDAEKIPKLINKESHTYKSSDTKISKRPGSSSNVSSSILHEEDIKSESSKPDLEKSFNTQRVKRQRTKRRRLISTDTEDCEKDKNTSKKVCSSSRSNSTKIMCSSSDFSTMERTIRELQNKVARLEKTSSLDEKRIEACENALIRQRNNDIKIIMDEKENELLLRMDLLYLDYDPRKICRLCLVHVDSKDSLTPLFLPRNNTSLLTMIKNTIDIEIEYDEKMPMGICGECVHQIQRIDYMKRKSQRSNSVIKKFTARRKVMNMDSSLEAAFEQSFEGGRLSSDGFDDDSEISEVKIEDVFSLGCSEIEIKQEPLSDDEYSENLHLIVENLQYGTYKKTRQVLNTCKRCDTTFTSVWTFINHKKYCQRVFKCGECGKCFWSHKFFVKHKRKKLSCASNQVSRTCTECKIIFRWKYQYLFHLAENVC